MDVFVIYPIHLFHDIQSLIRGKYNRIILLEEPLYFSKHTYHIKKLILHRASMKQYETYLQTYCESVIEYVEHDKVAGFWKKAKEYRTIHCYDPVDHDIRKELVFHGVSVFEHPGFITSLSELREFHVLHGHKKFRHDSIFYKWQRERLKLKLGNKLTYDHENRGAFPLGEKDVFNPISIDVSEATHYIKTHFKTWGNPDDFVYSIDHTMANRALVDFLHKRLAKFGTYQDAVSPDIKWGYHSVLSPMLNIGLLTDNDVVLATIEYGAKHKVPMNSLEGFIRQIIGWKSAIRYMYEFHYDKFVGKNHLDHRRKMPATFWNATTGIEPIDATIMKLYNTGYLHHIERLMVMGNFMLLCNIKPSDIYEWFMLTIDAYPWVMVANVLGMSQFADGGFFMTRPYFSSSNYIVKQSHGLWKGPWTETWDALYYAFIHRHAVILSHNYATGSAVTRWKAMSPTKKKAYLDAAKAYLK